MSAYQLCDVSPRGMEEYKASGYLSAVPRIAANHGSVYRARGGVMEVLEGDWLPKRMVIIEFPTMENLKGFFDDPEYQPWKQIRQGITDSKLVAVEGLSEPLTL